MKTKTHFHEIADGGGRPGRPFPGLPAGGLPGTGVGVAGNRPPAASNQNGSPGELPGTALAIHPIPRRPTAGQHGPDAANHRIHPMKNHTSLLVALLLGLGAVSTLAQESNRDVDTPSGNDQDRVRPRIRQQSGPAHGGARRPMAQAPKGQNRRAEGPGQMAGGPQAFSPLVRALDANGDRVIDATEIQNASRALRKLDRNGDGQITPREILPAARRGPGGPDNAVREQSHRGPGRPEGAGQRQGQRPRHAPPVDQGE